MTNQEIKTLTVVGLGYVGLPLAVLAKEKGWQVNGLDIDQEKISQINEGKSPFKDDDLQTDLTSYPITATDDFSVAKSSDVIVVAVPTPVDKNHNPDLSPVTDSLKSLLPHLRSGQVLVVESTINPGVMEEVVVPLLQERSDLKIDSSGEEDVLYLAHCPERINPGDKKWSVRNIPRVLGGFSGVGVKKAQEFYESILEAPVKALQSATEAEAVKILENTFRDINIAYINEMARSFDAIGINITNVIEGAATKPFAFMPHYPGNGVGGHCISVDPYYMIERGRQAGFNHEFLKLAREINEGMPAYSVEVLEQELKKQGLSLEKSKIALLGLAYKKDVADTRNSPAIRTLEILREKNLDVAVYDPFVVHLSTSGSLEEVLDGADAAILACDHTKLVEELTAIKLSDLGVKIIVDGKNALHQDAIQKRGLAYHGIGRQ